jgi:hypothetical protein
MQLELTGGYKIFPNPVILGAEYLFKGTGNGDGTMSSLEQRLTNRLSLSLLMADGLWYETREDPTVEL